MANSQEVSYLVVNRLNLVGDTDSKHFQKTRSRLTHPDQFPSSYDESDSHRLLVESRESDSGDRATSALPSIDAAQTDHRDIFSIILPIYPQTRQNIPAAHIPSPPKTASRVDLWINGSLPERFAMRPLRL